MQLAQPFSGAHCRFAAVQSGNRVSLYSPSLFTPPFRPCARLMPRGQSWRKVVGVAVTRRWTHDGCGMLSALCMHVLGKPRGTYDGYSSNPECCYADRRLVVICNIGCTCSEKSATSSSSSHGRPQHVVLACLLPHGCCCSWLTLPQCVQDGQFQKQHWYHASGPCLHKQ